MNKIQHINTKVSKLDAKATRVKSLRAQICALESQQDHLQDEIDALYEKMDKLEEQVDNDIAVEIDSTENQIVYFEEKGNTKKVKWLAKKLRELEKLERKLASI